MPLKSGKTSGGMSDFVSREVYTFRKLPQERYREEMDKRSSGDLRLSKECKR